VLFLCLRDTGGTLRNKNSQQATTQ